MSSEFEQQKLKAYLKHSGTSITTSFSEVDFNAGWDAALASQQQLQGDTCKAEPKHPRWALQMVTRTDGNISWEQQVCLLCHHAQVLAAKDAELTAAKYAGEKKWERIQTLEVELKGSDNALAAAQSRIVHLEAVVNEIHDLAVQRPAIGHKNGKYFSSLDEIAAKSAAPQPSEPHPHIWTDAYPLSQQTTPVGQYCSVEGCGEWRRLAQAGEPVKVLDATDEHYESIRSTSSKEHGDRK